MLLKTAILAIILTSVLNLNISKEKVECESIRKVNFNCIKERASVDTVIQFIKHHEGFNNGFKYTCLAGYKTIGYGHVIKSNENFPQQITEQQADSLLRADLSKAIKLVKHHYPDLTGSKLLAIGHLTFCKGVGSLLRFDLIDKATNEIDTAKLITLKYPQNRKFEIYLMKNFN